MADNASLITLGCFAILALAYVFYGRFVAARVFQLNSDRITPAHRFRDGVDYVPTGVPVLFGHHFASIAGLGPILGPAVAVIWGWFPAIIWVLVGSIFIGAVHDLGALTVSLRFRGRSIGDLCKELIGARARLLFLIVIFFLMSLAMGAFVIAIASLLVNFRPDAVTPSLGLIVVAMVMGVAVYKFRAPLSLSTGAALAAFGLLIWLGVQSPVLTYDWFLPAETQSLLEAGRQAETALGDPELAAVSPTVFHAPYGSIEAVRYLNGQEENAAAENVLAAQQQAHHLWIAGLLAYGFIASVLPVWLLLQPRDYINSFQLYAALSMLLGGMILAGFNGSDANVIHVEPIRSAEQVPDDVPPIFPFLLVTIACGAVSGFHSLVSSGTTVRQLNRETDARPIGFGAMLTEAALAVLVIMACVAGLGTAAWEPGGAYSSWKGLGGLAGPLDAVVQGGANFLSWVGVPLVLGQAFLAVTIVAFAMTTLDSATRLLRFNVEEIFRSVGLERIANRYVASLVAVAGIAFFALVPAGKTLWELFGTTNQLLAGLTLLAVSVYLYRSGRSWKLLLITVIPMILMLTVSIIAMGLKLGEFLATPERIWGLIIVSIAVLILAAWLILEALAAFLRGRVPLNFEDITAPHPEPDEKSEATAHIG